MIIVLCYDNWLTNYTADNNLCCLFGKIIMLSVVKFLC